MHIDHEVAAGIAETAAAAVLVLSYVALFGCASSWNNGMCLANCHSKKLRTPSIAPYYLQAQVPNTHCRKTKVLCTGYCTPYCSISICERVITIPSERCPVSVLKATSTSTAAVAAPELKIVAFRPGSSCWWIRVPVANCVRVECGRPNL